MNGGPIRPWSEYAKEEWERMGIHLTGPHIAPPSIMSDSYTAADPLTVEEPSWQIAAAASDHGGAPAMLGLAMLVVAFAVGVLVGLLVPR